ncbi:hypothetical protein GSY71_04730 [Pusillimonas sp. TS35]|uniref:hypothetical protein n=1 Tax=Paracandidimonas lactea TaxID=2895524 RepID=UPI00136DD773|nr:hypothetical protein [Paracandidimonas lactea]MYN12456.1 hypothetical protein [Pusillimonas sp. TS35]
MQMHYVLQSGPLGAITARGADPWAPSRTDGPHWLGVAWACLLVAAAGASGGLALALPLAFAAGAARQMRYSGRKPRRYARSGC